MTARKRSSLPKLAPGFRYVDSYANTTSGYKIIKDDDVIGFQIHGNGQVRPIFHADVHELAYTKRGKRVHYVSSSYVVGDALVDRPGPLEIDQDPEGAALGRILFEAATALYNRTRNRPK